ncbi:type II toxin-antitoxin system Phd/YefM family antitoxin [Planktothricoides raciborskii]|uniref:Antitoxin n=1 Tax=Planktothricoides raciborskii FACHB-1370 TaxID=2949576 RepID=A0ABR8ENS7_9CYAN|nr:type II toxin-antitoxin system prevent-host-death family antitoxin [Planktothricoides raciborskii]MBD2547247.1 type II toxin-antitoxin system prevent-host-death family antitoxin [Planktothricoides raciborskii FACHB-1370]MBD2585749.1 type II toxin-antitoxin system prevent-host-death family antitoxin [Planktothricoides raciborskii FACHB-1261]
MSQVDITEANTQLQQLLAIAMKGEEVIITQGDRAIAKLVAVRDTSLPEKPRRQFGSMKDVIWVADDFDAPLTEEFKEYME